MLKCIKNRKAYLIKTALYGCLKHLNDGAHPEKPMTVCMAIYAWRDVEPTEFKHKATTAAVDYIADIIAPQTFVHHWLKENHGIISKSTHEIQLYRRAWVHHMIKQMRKYERQEP